MCAPLVREGLRPCTLFTSLARSCSTSQAGRHLLTYTQRPHAPRLSSRAACGGAQSISALRLVPRCPAPAPMLDGALLQLRMSDTFRIHAGADNTFDIVRSSPFRMCTCAADCCELVYDMDHVSARARARTHHTKVLFHKFTPGVTLLRLRSPVTLLFP